MRAILFFTFLLVTSGTVAQDSKPVDLSGYWEGSLQVGAIPLRFTFHFKADAKETWTAKLTSHDEGLKDLSVKSIKLEERTLSFEIPSSTATFTGKLNGEGTRIVGTWKQSRELPLLLKKVDRPLVLNRPQMPKKPFPYLEEELTIENQPAGVKLSGTLTRPRGDGQFPIVVLISGSGPQDRDESLLGHKPFLVLADHLTRHGIAVFRYDDRGTFQSTGEFGNATTKDFASDVVAIVKALQNRPGIDPKRIGLIGHSEGGVIAPMVAVECPEIAFIVLLAGTGVPGDQILEMQSRAIQKSMGLPDFLIERSLKLNRTLFALLREDADEAKLLAAGQEYLKGLTLLERTLGGSSAEEQINQAVKQLSVPWMRFFIKHDPRPVLKQVKCPVLAINGELDLQVPPTENLTAISSALREGGNDRFTAKEFPKLNHLFQNCKSGLPTEYGTIEETLSPEVLKFVQEWITERVGK